MSYVQTSIVEDIRTTLDLIEKLLPSLQSMDASPYEEETATLSTVVECVAQTKNVYLWAQANGGFCNTNHSPLYTDVMARWTALIDDIHWAMFGYQDTLVSAEKNKLKVIHLKLKNIHNKLRELIPALC
jgi:hypothetical protein